MSDCANLYTDGSALTNPRSLGIGFVVYSEGIIRLEGYRHVGFGTSNEAEYKAVIQGPQVCLDKGYCKANIKRMANQE
jgi:ribonuclease HI